MLFCGVFDINSLNVMHHKTAGIFEMRVKNAEGKEEVWTIDLKTTCSVYRGPSKTKPNVTIMLSDETLSDLGDGKVRS